MAIRPIKHDWAFEAWEAQNRAHWFYKEIPMAKDVKDWETELTNDEKEVIGRILKGFAQTESHVNEYWSTFVTTWIKDHEIRDMAIAFASMESTHKHAYQYINDLLGLQDFEAFLEDPATMQKLEKLIEVDPKDASPQNIAKSIAVFSACAEGIQLFSSFAILYSFLKRSAADGGKVMEGVCKQISFSIRDESLHSTSGCILFQKIIEEVPDIFTDSFKEVLYDSVDTALKNEFNYIEQIFNGVSLTTITKEQLINFMYDRANRKLLELMLEPKYEVNQELLVEMDWFYQAISGEAQSDFFANRETQYSIPNSDWGQDDLFD